MLFFACIALSLQIAFAITALRYVNAYIAFYRTFDRSDSFECSYITVVTVWLHADVHVVPRRAGPRSVFARIATRARLSKLEVFRL